MKDTFKFVMPAELSKNDDGEWKIKGLASTEHVDRQNEIVVQKGISLTPIEQGRGFFNFEHQNDPENLVGTIDSYSQTKDGLFLEGKLFKNHARAKAIHEIMSSMGKSEQGRVGLSVEGRVLERDPNDQKIVKRCEISNCAITFNPVNTNTYADLVKSLNAAGSIQFDTSKSDTAPQEESPIFTATQVADIVTKALSVSGAYADTAHADLTGGDALSQEDLDKKKKKKMKMMTKSEYSGNIYEMLDRLQNLYPDNTRSEIWGALKERLHTSFPNIEA